jgi:small ligand-binding sensory domain FIST
MTVQRQSLMAASTAVSDQPNARAAAREVSEALSARLTVRPDLLVVFGTFHHRALFSDAIGSLRSDLHPAHLLACTAEGVIGNDSEIERSCGLVAIALRLPGVTLRPFHFDIHDGPPSVWSPGFIRERMSLPPDEGALPFRGTLMLSDPFSIHAQHACTAIDDAAGPGGARIFGGLASGASHAGLNVLGCDRRTSHSGMVGLTVFGDVTIDGFVSQGCAPLGPDLIVTKARGNELLELGGRPALVVAQEIAESLGERERALLSSGLLVGVAFDAGKPRLGRGDFLIRELHAVDGAHKSIVLREPVAVGSTVRFHARDARTAHEDLDMLLDSEQLREPPVAGLLFSCNARGTRMFGEPNHDAALVSRRLAGAPIAGFHCAGEIGPRHGRSYLHTQTASLALFRRPRPDFTEV